MAVTGNQASHRYQLKAAHPGSGFYWIRFTTNGTSHPDGQVGDTGEITVVRLSPNVYQLNLAHRWARVVVVGQPAIQGSAPNLLTVLGAAEDYTQDNAVAVRIVDEALVLEAVESDDKVCEVCLVLSGRI